VKGLLFFVSFAYSGTIFYLVFDAFMVDQTTLAIITMITISVSPQRKEGGPHSLPFFGANTLSLRADKRRGSRSLRNVLQSIYSHRYIPNFFLFGLVG